MDILRVGQLEMDSNRRRAAKSVFL